MPDYTYFAVRLARTPTRCLLNIASKARGGKYRSHWFRVEHIECSDLAYRIIKLDPERDGSDRDAASYDINITDGTCDCKGYCAYGHMRPCRHLQAFLNLKAKGALP